MEVPRRVRFADSGPSSPYDGLGAKTEKDVPLILPVHRKPTHASDCGHGCLCQCHSKQIVKAFSSVDRIFGRLFLGYNGPLYGQQCNLDTCHQRKDTSTQLTYFFPRWFVHKVFTVSMNAGLGAPSFNIKIRRSVTETSNLFSLSKVEGVEGSRQMFIDRTASLDDIDPRGGWTPLHFAIDHGCIEVCKLLLSCGADCHWEDNTGTTPTDVAWRNIMHLKAPPQLAEAYSVLFPGTEYLQERHFNKLHKIILGIEQGNLEAEIVSHEELVNGRDLDGWTPLHWAARRGSSQTVSLLLAHGADPFLLTENEKRGPLHLAAMANSTLCLQQLLNYRVANKILDINAKDTYFGTPLFVAAQYNCAAATSFLIKAGADLNEPCDYGQVPLMSAITEGIHECATLLIRAGADFCRETDGGNTILHLAAYEADLKMLALLTKAQMRNLNPMAQNKEGETALDILATRKELPEGIVEAFDRLL